MRRKMLYHPDLNFLNTGELGLLEDACQAVESFVRKSAMINGCSHKTRDAHVTTYASLHGSFSVYDSFEEYSVFPSEVMDCTIRISNAHMKFVSQRLTIPAYGFSVKISDAGSTVLNLPMVNFPLFPINNVSRFLKIFKAINYFYSGNSFQKLWQAGKIFNNTALVLPGFFHPSFINQLRKLIMRWRRFILAFDYHSIGSYRLGDPIVKYRLVPLDAPSKSNETRIDRAIEDYVNDRKYELELQVQY